MLWYIHTIHIPRTKKKYMYFNYNLFKIKMNRLIRKMYLFQ